MDEAVFAEVMCETLNGILSGAEFATKYVRMNMVNDLLRDRGLPEITLDDCEEFVPANV